MQKWLTKFFVALFGFSMLAGLAAEEQLEQDLARLQSEWQAVVSAPASSEEKAHALHTLAQKAELIAERHPDKTEAQYWAAYMNNGYDEVANSQHMRQ
ncbi:hypothetical protein CAI21_15830 [Alkalilimnicola ehrlichii]|uniref:Uncharacterized protein n=1 Tax=Alkalilimnicola ehrlichii TaxID=351052 RepID=A0A3E0WP11_9GAMM|nr:hypothetical protein [Alkalilimnicola ehrlichii]RFA27019.1 hypothetical protein CAI21_15830 [Alkalilimnicola ehrlichii]RFA34139.1 hypothetical protein CAL65_15960 [Alkalilimnicola ehrlichii]